MTILLYSHRFLLWALTYCRKRERQYKREKETQKKRKHKSMQKLHICSQKLYLQLSKTRGKIKCPGRGMTKQILLQTYNGILLSNIKERTTGTHNNTDEF